ncbi:hypothetical protein BES08_07325 [Novosphingobium resinovorum]|uniref:Uncharacterized protein n=2 Tax=Novosphingobium resinovorum TaxID=158500 RepID=A0A1D8A8W8_9SPHN|nr:hypothetical protein BES08_07325 [Novosphingobium resinovorum]
MLVKDRPASYRSLEELIAAATEAVAPPERITVTEAAKKYVRIKEKNYSGLWSEDKTPYLVEPQNVLTSLAYQGMVFVGPARTGKSQMWLNWMSHSAICDPADMMLVQMSQGRAREFSQSDLRKHFRNSADVRAKLVPGRVNDNVFDKTFISGMRVTIVHPSINEFSGKTVGRNWAMDYDRLPLSIDGEGDAWTLLSKRGETLGRYAMTVVESSPGFDVNDARWIPSSPHEAPPCEGILSLYNMGDRRRRYWSCPHCGQKFEPDFKLFDYPASADPHDAAEQVVMVCPGNGCRLVPDLKHDLEHDGRWLREGEIWLEDGSVVGQPRRSDIASFWLKGPSAAFNTWQKLVLNYLNAKSDFERTGSEEKLRAVTNTSFGLPYTPKSIEAGRLPDELKKRARAYNYRGEVPEGVRFLVTTVDVQKDSFVVHTFGIAPVTMVGGAQSMDVYHVDMWKITKSRRIDADGHPLKLDPASFKEDWHVLIDQVIEREYPLGDGSGRFMKAKLVACDSGGAASAAAVRLNKALDGPVVSVTSNAYDFWRYLRLHDPEQRNYHMKFHLLKGEPSRQDNMIRVDYPDSQQKDKWAIARGDVPVWKINSNVAKDQVSNMLGRTEPGGQFHFPEWFDVETGELENIDWLYTQLTAEIRLQSGWENRSRRRNEAFDLAAYCVAFLRMKDIKIDRLDWSQPPSWAAEWDVNDHVFDAQGARGTKPASESTSLEQLGSLLG